MRQPFWQDSQRTLYCGDCRTMPELSDESIQMVCTSPPYWGLRKYNGNQDLIWGDRNCEHQWQPYKRPAGGGHPTESAQVGNTKADIQRIYDGQGAWCCLCNAWRGAYGLEPTPEMYIQHTIEILREIRRVLRKDGVVFWNIGDSYWGSQQGYGTKNPTPKQASNAGTLDTILSEREPLSKGKHEILKPKDLCLIPFHVAIEAQRDGWWIRSVIIWNKLNPMPESVTDRPTESHEYILMLTKSARYYWDMEAVREPMTEGWENYAKSGLCKKTTQHKFTSIGLASMTNATMNPNGRNLRSVWIFPTQPYPEAHFATFPKKLPELCIKAATPEIGCCAKCGTPWERIVETKAMEIRRSEWGELAGNRTASSGTMISPSETKTIGWRATCKCNIKPPVPSIVLDPFCGSGTTLEIAAKLGRKSIGYDISEEYCKLALERNRQTVMNFVG